MELLFVADPLEAFKIYKDTTFSMMREAQRRGQRIVACEPRHVSWRSGGVVQATVREITLTGEADAWFRVERTALRPLKDFGAVLMRKDPPFDSEYFYATHLLEQAEREHVVGAERGGGAPGRGQAGQPLARAPALGDVEACRLQHGERFGAGAGQGLLGARQAVGHLADRARAADEGDPAVPGVEPSPASLSWANTSAGGSPEMSTMCAISIGEYACRCRSGAWSLATRSQCR